MVGVQPKEPHHNIVAARVLPCRMTATKRLPHVGESKKSTREPIRNQAGDDEGNSENRSSLTLLVEVSMGACP